jgi:DMSO/TMAO reductase YedYZ molybdopterin-dependent catalytic subunit
MTPPLPPQRPINRRRALQWLGLSGLGYLSTGCVNAQLGAKINQVNGQLAMKIGDWTEPFNQTVESLLLNPQKPVPEYPYSAIDKPEALLVNTFDQTPMIDSSRFNLIIDGEVAVPLTLSMADLQAMPLTSMVIQHVCVEGWAAIVHWGGVRLRDLAKLAQPKPGVRYVFFESADGYYESWDIASSLHPQTLLAYQRNGEPLPVDNGAPLRLATPIKLGYKLSKWVTRVTFMSELPQRKGYWEDEGYEWFGGI